MSDTNIEILAKILVQSIIDSKIDVIHDFYFYLDHKLLREKHRVGVCGLINHMGEKRGISIDCPYEEILPFTPEDLLWLVNFYMKKYIEDRSLVLFTEEELKEAYEPFEE